MKVLSLTKLGWNFSSHPSSSPSTALKVLYLVRRQGGSCASERIDSLGMPESLKNEVLRKLVNIGALKVIG